jgi:hypothetical protein
LPRRADLAEYLARLRAKVLLQAPRLLAVAQRAFLVVALLAIAFYLWRNADQLGALLSGRVLLHCLACAVLLGALHPLIAGAFFQLQRYAGITLDLHTSLAVYMRRIPARYVPGGIWHAVSRYADMKFDAGVDAAALRWLFLMESALVAVSGFLVSGVGVWTLPAQSGIWLFAAGQGALGLLFGIGAALLARGRAWKRLGLGIALYLLIWTGAATAFFVVATAVADGTGSCSAAAVGSSYVIASVQGYVAIFAPQGWGVAETSFALLNPCGIAVPSAVAAFLLYRLSAIFGDLLSYAVWAVLTRSSLRKKSVPVQVD